MSIWPSRRAFPRIRGARISKRSARKLGWLRWSLSVDGSAGRGGWTSSSGDALGDTGAADLSALQVTREDFLAGLREKSSQVRRENSSSSSTLTFASLAGLTEVKRVLARRCSSTRTRETNLYQRVGFAPPRGIRSLALQVPEDRHGAGASGEKQLP